MTRCHVKPRESCRPLHPVAADTVAAHKLPAADLVQAPPGEVKPKYRPRVLTATAATRSLWHLPCVCFTDRTRSPLAWNRVCASRRHSGSPTTSSIPRTFTSGKATSRWHMCVGSEYSRLFHSVGVTDLQTGRAPVTRTGPLRPTHPSCSSWFGEPGQSNLA